MAKTLDDLTALLETHGYPSEQMLDAVVATRLETKHYKNASGEHNLEILLTFDRPNDCVAVEILRAFDLRTTEYREATLSCLMAATFRTPLLRPSLDPADGEIRLRVDCPCGADGAHDDDVLRAVTVLHSALEAWYPEVAGAMTKGTFDVNRLARFTLARLPNVHPPKSAGSAPADAAANPPAAAATDGPEAQPPETPVGKRNVGAFFRAAAISQRLGAHPNRLKRLLEFRAWLDQHRPDFDNRN
jgi:hypothetical protein